MIEPNEDIEPAQTIKKLKIEFSPRVSLNSEKSSSHYEEEK